MKYLCAGLRWRRPDLRPGRSALWPIHDPLGRRPPHDPPVHPLPLRWVQGRKRLYQGPHYYRAEYRHERYLFSSRRYQWQRACNPIGAECVATSTSPGGESRGRRYRPGPPLKNCRQTTPARSAEQGRGRSCSWLDEQAGTSVWPAATSTTLSGESRNGAYPPGQISGTCPRVIYARSAASMPKSGNRPS